MLFSTQTDVLAKRFGLEKAVDMLIEAGYPAIDISMFNVNEVPFTDDYREVAARLLEKANAAGVKFIQAHAPFGGGYEKYINDKVPLMPRALEFCSLLGIECIVIHPLQKGRYYGREEELFEMNLEFYRSLAPIAKKYGVKIAIENMWQRHPVNGYISDDVLAPPEELRRMYDELADSEAFTVCLDLGHVALCGREPEDAIRVIGHDRLGALHVHDVDYVSDLHTLPGVGRINWEKVCEALAEIDYTGSFNLEADNFYLHFLPEHSELCAKFMADTCRIYTEKIDQLRKK